MVIAFVTGYRIEERRSMRVNKSNFFDFGSAYVDNEGSGHMTFYASTINNISLNSGFCPVPTTVLL